MAGELESWLSPKRRQERPEVLNVDQVVRTEEADDER